MLRATPGRPVRVTSNEIELVLLQGGNAVWTRVGADAHANHLVITSTAVTAHGARLGALNVLGSGDKRGGAASRWGGRVRSREIIRVGGRQASE